MQLITRVLPILFLFCSSTAWAQIQDEIGAYSRDSIKTEINNGRLLCLENVLKKDEAKTKEIITYLEALTKNTGFKAFTYYEYLAIYALLEDWPAWVAYARSCDYQLYKNFYPETVTIYGSIYEALFEQRDMLKLKMMASTMDQETKDMYAIYDEYNTVGASMKYKELMRAYKEKYPVSKYQCFIDDILDHVPTKGNFVVGLGTSYFGFTGPLSKKVDPGFAFSMNVDINVKQVHTSLHMNIGGPKINRPFNVTRPTDTIDLVTGENTSLAEFGLNMGYYALSTNYFRLAPIVNVSYFELTTSRYSSMADLDEYRFKNTIALGVGLNADIKLFVIKDKSGNPAALDVPIILQFTTGYNAIGGSGFESGQYYGRVTLSMNVGEF